MSQKLGFWGVLSIVSWLVLAALIVIGVASFSRVQSDLREAQANSEAMRLRAAELDSQLNALDEMSNESLEFLRERSDQLDSLGRYCAETRTQDARILNLCSAAASAIQADYSGYLEQLQEAAAARGRGDFRKSVSLYKNTFNAVAGVKDFGVALKGEAALARMLALEGQAYGHFRLGEYDDAKNYIADAVSLQNVGDGAVSGFVMATSMKIDCQATLSESDARHLFTTNRQVLEEAIRAANDPIWRSRRERDLAYFLSDEELKLVCHL